MIVQEILTHRFNKLREQHTDPVADLKSALLSHKKTIHKSKDSKDKVYKIIDNIMTRIAKSHGISGKKLHNLWIEKYKRIPDTWIMHQ